MTIHRSKYYPFSYAIFVLGIAWLFTSAVAVDADLYRSNQMGQILFFARSFCWLSPIFIIALCCWYTQEADALFLLVLLLGVWTVVRGRPGGLLQDEKFFYYAGCMASFFVARTLFRNIGFGETQYGRYYLSFLLAAIVVVASAEAVIGQMQAFDLYPSYHADYKVTGTFFNPAPYAAFLLTCLPWALYLASLQGGLFNVMLSWSGYLSAVLIIMVLPSTLSRAAYLGTIVVMVTWFYSRYRPVQMLQNVLGTWGRRFIAMGIAVVLMAGTGVGLYQMKSESAFGRTLIWKVSLLSVQERPLTGSGFDTYAAEFAPKQVAYFQEQPRSEREQRVAGMVQWAFNEPLQMVVELGLIGGAILLALVVYALFFKVNESAVQEGRLLLAAARSSLAGLMVFGCFSYPFYSQPCLLLFFFSLAVISAFSAPVAGKTLAIVLNGAVLMAVLLVAVYYLPSVQRLKQGYARWEEAIRYYDIAQYDRAIESFEASMPVLRGNGLFLLQYGKTLSMAKRCEEAISILKQGQTFYRDDVWYITMGNCCEMLGDDARAGVYYKEAAAMIPHRFYPKYLLAMLYDRTGKREESVEIARELLHQKVKVDSRAVEQIRMEMQVITDRYDRGAAGEATIKDN